MSFWFKVLRAFAFFVLGILATQVWSNYTDVLLSPDSGVLMSPPDKIEARNVLVYDDRVVIPVSGARVVNYADTGSMIPVLDSGSNGIVVEPSSVREIGVGDIVSFHLEGDLIAHRVIETGEDPSGVYFLVKGDNSSEVERIRFEDIEGVLIGVVY